MPEKSPAKPRPPGRPKNSDNPSTTALLRIFHIHQRLCDGRKVVSRQLEIELNTSRSTVMRTVKAMKKAFGAPIDFDQSTKTYRYRQACDFLPIVKLEQKEALMLVMAAYWFAGCGALASGETLVGGIAKIMPLLHSVAVYSPEQFKRVFAAAPKARVRELQFFDRLVTAIIERRALEILYQSPKAPARGTEWREVHPLWLTPRRGKWVLLAREAGAAAIKMYVLVRLQDLKFTGAQFERPADFDVEALLGASVGRFTGGPLIEVHVIAAASARDYIEESPWHDESQRITPRPDGRIDVRLRVGSRSLLELRNELLRWGELVEVVSPPELRTDMIATLKHTLAHYGAAGKT